MKTRIIFTFMVIFAFINLFSACIVDETNQQNIENNKQVIETTLDFIDFQLQQGIITSLQAIKLKGYYFLAPTLLPEEYRFDKVKIVKSATPFILDILHNWEKFSPAEQKLFTAASSRPDMQQYYDTPEGHFRIHYDLDGSNAIYKPTLDDNGDGIPDYINWLATASEYVWTEETTSSGSIGLNYDPPANDGTDGGGNNLYDLYLKHYSGAYGVTIPAGSATNQYPGRNAMKSYIYLDPTYAGFGYQNNRQLPLQVTIAHEFFHSIQFIYNSNATTFFWETSSVWMEDVMYDDINDYYMYLRSRFKKPYKPLKDTDLMYGTTIWNHFLVQYYNDINIIQHIWEQAINTSNIYDATDQVLADRYSSSFKQAFQIYTQWNYICGKNDDGNHYEEGAAWTSKLSNGEVGITYEHSQYPVLGSQPEYAPEPTSANYIRFLIDSSKVGFKVCFDGNDTIEWRASLIIAHTDGSYTELTMDLDANYYGTYKVSELSNVSSIILIAQNMQKGGGGVGTYFYRGRYFQNDPVEK